MVDFTLVELADRVGMTPRNVREWQTIGLLPPPERRGRVAYYGSAHLGRIERIQSLRADGFPLDVIRQFLDRADDSGPDVLRLTSAVLDPLSGGGQLTLSLTELTRRLPGAEDALVVGGLVVVAGDNAVITDPLIFSVVEQLHNLGLPSVAVLAAVKSLLEHQIEGVGALVEAYHNAVWKPFVEDGLPASRFPAIAESSGKMRELIIAVGGQTLRQAADKVIATVAVDQANKLKSPP